MVSSGSGSSELANTINWIRGQDNYEDENQNSSLADTRATIEVKAPPAGDSPGEEVR